MKTRQKHSRAEATFSFGETALTYAFRYGATLHETVADYFEIKPERKFTSRRDGTHLYFGAAMMMIGLAALAAQIFLFSTTPFAAAWLVPGLALLAVYVIRPTHFRILQAAGAPVWIIEDRESPKIIAEIELRRRNRLADIYGPLSLANAPHLEIRKVDWLVEESVFTREEGDRQIAAIHARLAEKAAAAEIAAENAKISAPGALAI